MSDNPETPSVTEAREKAAAADKAQRGAQTDDLWIAALKRERAGYVLTGKADRVKAVDAELKKLGHGSEKSEPPRERGGRESRQSTASSSKQPAEKTAAKRAAKKS